jgi:hypothetical protein
MFDRSTSLINFIEKVMASKPVYNINLYQVKSDYKQEVYISNGLDQL